MRERPGAARAIGRLAALIAAALLVVVVAAPVAGQEDEDDGRTITIPGSGREVPLYVVEGDIFILEDRDWCENLISLTEDRDTDSDFMLADPARTELCTVFLERLALNEVALLPRSLAAQLVALPDEMLEPLPTVSFDPADDLVAVSGRGESRSESFELSGGAYDATVQTNIDCAFFAGFLTRTSDGISLADIEGPGPVLGVPPDEYFWDVLAPGCDWSITLASY